jgi:hypothetical protein
MASSEAMAALKTDSDVVEVCPSLGILDIQAPKATLPQIPLIVSSGVTKQNEGDYILAGVAREGHPQA